ncbi:MAG TPA: type IV toxin-antitoxin system AbiEi family antitoxin domain-containing protein [Acidimicrobiia bacterium]|nr:type IV toxin-antitoxin system AbiEi family antitoxin domain-containing protein [Acidimicrobiia bacterium]
MRAEKRTSDAKDQPEAIIARLAERQYGVFTGQQAFDAGLNQGQLNRRVANGAWERVHRGVFRVAGSAPSPHQRLMIACLSAGPAAVVSHAAAAWLWGLPGGDPSPQVTLPLPARSRNLQGVKVHATSFLPACDRTVRYRIPVTDPARLVVDMAAVLPRRELEILLDAVLSKELARDTRIGWRVAELAARGRQGLGPLRDMLHARSREGGVPASVLESLARLVLAGLPPHRFNKRVVADKERVVDVDFDGIPLFTEFDGWDGPKGAPRTHPLPTGHRPAERPGHPRPDPAAVHLRRPGPTPRLGPGDCDRQRPPACPGEGRPAGPGGLGGRRPAGPSVREEMPAGEEPECDAGGA